MGKQHSSSANDQSGRRSTGRPNSNRPERSGGYKARSSEGGYGSRPDRDSRPDRPERGRGEGYSASRPAFGQGGGRPGGSDNRRSFGGERPAYGGSREGRGERPSGGGSREGRGERPAYGGAREGRSERPAYGQRPSYGGPPREERPRRAENERPNYGDGGEERTKNGGEERAKKSLWQGQPVRYEGLPTVPRGQPGQRNRKFIKQDPAAPAGEAATPARPTSGEARPAYQGRDERRAWQERGEKPAGYNARPNQGSRDEATPRRDSYGSGSREGGYTKREGSSNYRDSRPGGPRDDRRPAGGGSPDTTGNAGRDERRPYGGSRDGDRTGSRDDRRPASDQREGGYNKARSTGERPSAGGPSTFRERRDAMRDQVRGGRSSGTSYGRTEQPSQTPDYKNLKHYEDDKNRGNKRRREDENDFGTEEMRLNRYIANAGICSRREADSLIAAGEIKVNGEVVTEMGYKVQPTDTVQYGKTNLNREKLVYVLLNKPKDFITTTDDPEGRKTVMDLVANASKERIFPVGRLDRNTTGLLLFTNDGEVAQKLSHPSHKNKKIYQVELSQPLAAEHLRQISEGVELEDGKAEVDDVAVVAGNPHFVGVELHIGRNRIVRRIFEHLGYEVVTLDRVQYAGITKKDLPRGKWRFLSEQEVIRLKYFM